MYKVYCHTFPNGKKYIGITCQELNRRWRDGKGYEGQPVYNAILKYGWVNIKHEVLFDNLTKEEAEQKEIELIKALETDSHKNGYNVEEGGSASVLSEETKEKLRENKKAYFKTHEHWNQGKHWSDEVKKKIAQAHKGKKMGEEQRKKRSEMFSGKNNPMYGTKMSKEHKKKLQEACVKAKSKPCMCVETQVIYASFIDAERKTGINARTISYVCNGNKRYKTAGGFHWVFVDKGAYNGRIWR